MSDKVISLHSKLPLEVELQNQEAQVSAAARRVEEAYVKNQENLLEILARAADLVRAGRLEGLVLVGRDPTTEMFLTTVHMNQQLIPRQAVFAYAGCLASLQLELADMSQMAPTIGLDGSVIDPFDHPGMADLDPEDFG